MKPELVRRCWVAEPTEAIVEVWYEPHAIDKAVRSLETVYTAARDELIRRSKELNE